MNDQHTDYLVTSNRAPLYFGTDRALARQVAREQRLRGHPVRVERIARRDTGAAVGISDCTVALLGALIAHSALEATDDMDVAS